MPQFDVKQESKNGAMAKEISFEALNLGCMMRMADALEKLTVTYDQMQKDIAYYKDLSRRRMEHIESLENTLKTEHGHKTRLKNQKEDLIRRITTLELEKANLLESI